MSFDPVTFGLANQIKQIVNQPHYEYFWTSRTVTAERAGTVVIRALGAGGNGSSNRGGNGGTVATKEIQVSAGDTIQVVIPAAESDLVVRKNGAQQLKVYGAKNGVAHTNPVGADYFVHGTVVDDGKTGGGAAMILEGGSSAGKVTGRGGAGACGNGSDRRGGGITGDAGTGHAGAGIPVTPELIILRVAVNVAGDGGGLNGGGGSSQQASSGGFGAGGGVFTYPGGSTEHGGHGGFGGGGGGSPRPNGHGGSGGSGGGGGGGGDTAGSGGQGWVTLEWRYI